MLGWIFRLFLLRKLWGMLTGRRRTPDGRSTRR